MFRFSFFTAALLMLLAPSVKSASRQLDLVPEIIEEPGGMIFLTHLNSVSNLVLACSSLSGTTNNFWVVDGSASKPKVLGGCRVTGLATQASSNGRYAFVAAQDAGVHVIDLIDPAAPKLVKTLNTPGTAFRSLVVSNFLYVADGSAILVVDITNPTAPIAGKRLALGGNSWDIEVAGNYAYVANAGTSLPVLDVSDRTNPVFLRSITLGGEGRSDDVEVSDGHAYVTMDTGGLRILSLTNPEEPALIRTYTSDLLDPVSIVLHDNFAFLSRRFGGLYVLDVTDPSAPTLAGQFRNHAHQRSMSTGLTIANNRVFISLKDSLLEMLAIEPRPADPVPGAVMPFSGTTLSSLALGKSNVLLNASRLLELNVEDPTLPYVIRTNLNEFNNPLVIGEDAAVALSGNQLKVYARLPEDTFEPRGILNISHDSSLFFNRKELALRGSLCPLPQWPKRVSDL